MTYSKLFVLKQEIELIWMDMDYSRRARSNGNVTSKVEGGLITLCFESVSESDQILRWMTKESQDDTLEDVDMMEKGKICYYGNGKDAPPTKTYEFEDALLVDYSEEFNANRDVCIQTIITISPGIQNYGVEVLKPWNVSYVPPSEDSSNEEEEKLEEKKLVDFYLTDASGKIIEEYEVGDKIYLNIETVNRIDDKITLSLEDKSHDFKHNGKVLENDMLKDYVIKSDSEKIELTVIEELSQE